MSNSLTPEDLYQILNVKDDFLVPQVFLQRLQDKNQQIQVLSEIRARVDEIKDDIFLQYYQTRLANRKGLAQDYTPSVACDLLARLTYDDKPQDGCFLDICAGTGGITLAMLKIGYKHATCIELSKSPLPFLLCNLAIRNTSAQVYCADAVTEEIEAVYNVIPNKTAQYSTIEYTHYQPNERSLQAEDLLGFDAVVLNPPFSVKYNKQEHENDPRLQGFTLPPNKAYDFGFVIDAIHKVKAGGYVCAIVPPGCLYRKHAEEKIRRELVERGYLQAVIQLPRLLFENTDISTNILRIKKPAEHLTDTQLQTHTVKIVNASKHCTEIRAD